MELNNHLDEVFIDIYCDHITELLTEAPSLIRRSSAHVNRYAIPYYTPYRIKALRNPTDRKIRINTQPDLGLKGDFDPDTVDTIQHGTDDCFIVAEVDDTGRILDPRFLMARRLVDATYIAER